MTGSERPGPGRTTTGAALLTRGVVVPVALALALVVAVVVGTLSAHRAASAARAAVVDTGPVLAGLELPADGSAGPATVTLSASAAVHPRGGDVAAVVQRTVDARNARDRTAWAATVTAASVAATDTATFAAQTRSTRIGSVTVRRIDPVGVDDYVVPLDLVTTQDPADAPPDVRVPRLCWQVSATVTSERGSLRLSEALPGSALRTPC